MFRNYLKTSLRNVLTYKAYSLINIIGLAMGLAAVILIAIYVRYELSYDKYLNNIENIYRITSYQLDENKESYSISTSAALSPILVESVPGIEASSRVMNLIDNKITVNNSIFEDEKIYYAESSFIDIFTNYNLLDGYTEQSLSTSNSIVLSRSTALKLFGNEDPIGGQVLNQDDTLTVTGIFADIPENTHLHFDALISLATVGIEHYEKWNLKISYLVTYVKLAKNSNPDLVQKNIQELYLENYQPAEGHVRELNLQAVKDIHLFSKLDGDLASSGKYMQVLGFGGISAIILLLACINYINLATARSSRRSREVGVRKVLGAEKRQLLVQFMMESAIVTLISFVLATVIVELVFPFFKVLTAREGIVTFYKDFYYITGLFILYILVSIIAGFFPSLVLSRFNPANIFRDSASKGIKNTKFRDFLVSFQFFVSIALIFATTVIFFQLKFLSHKDLGFDKENVIVLNTFDEYLSGSLQAFKNEVISNRLVENASLSTGVPFVAEPDVITQMKLAEDEMRFDGHFIGVDENFFNTYDFKLLNGRLLSSSFPGDYFNSMLINESAAKAMK